MNMTFSNGLHYRLD